METEDRKIGRKIIRTGIVSLRHMSLGAEKAKFTEDMVFHREDI